MSSFNGLLDAIFLPPRNWVLNKALRFKSDDLDNTEVKMLKECSVDVIDNGTERSSDIIFSNNNGINEFIDESFKWIKTPL